MKRKREGEGRMYDTCRLGEMGRTKRKEETADVMRGERFRTQTVCMGEEAGEVKILCFPANKRSIAVPSCHGSFKLCPGQVIFPLTSKTKALLLCWARCFFVCGPEHSHKTRRREWQTQHQHNKEPNGPPLRLVVHHRFPLRSKSTPPNPAK